MIKYRNNNIYFGQAEYVKRNNTKIRLQVTKLPTLSNVGSFLLIRPPKEGIIEGEKVDPQRACPRSWGILQLKPP